MASTDSEWTGDMAIEDSCIQQTGVNDGSLNAKLVFFIVTYDNISSNKPNTYNRFLKNVKYLYLFK